MLRIIRDSKTEKRLEVAHCKGLFDLVTARLEFVILVLSNIGNPKFEEILNKNIISIPTETKTAFLNKLIGNNTEFTKREDWNLFLNTKNLNANITSSSNRIKLVAAFKKITSIKLKNILIAKPHELLVIETASINSFSGKNRDLLIGLFKNILQLIFDYDSFAKKGNHYNAFKLIDTSNVHSCPYCNLRNIVTNKVNISVNEFRQGLRSELDHFFPKNKHPLLALSFYNLIPSCLECNLRLKGRIPFDIERFLHPYIDGFDINKNEKEEDRVIFIYQFKNGGLPVTSVLNISENDITIKIICNKNISHIKKNKLLKLKSDTSIKGSINVFQLNYSYDDYPTRLKASSVLNYAQKISPSYVQSLEWFYYEMNDSFTKTFKEQLSVFWNEKDHTKASYSKLSRDLYIQELQKIGIKIK